MKTIKFYTLGCKVNQYDTQVIREQFLNSGFQELDNHLPADIYVINTCTVTANADGDSRHLIYQAQRHNPQARIIVTGCYTELDSDTIAKIPGVTFIVKNKDKNKILELLNEPKEYNKLPPQSVADSPIFLAKNEPNELNETGITGFSGHTRAFLKIQDGCDNFCSYCKVALVRGSLRSKPLNEIIQEAQQLAKNGFTPLETIGRQEKDLVSLTGFKEIVLSGICLGSYGKDLNPKLGLVDIIEPLEDIEGILRIRLSSIEINDVSINLINKIRQSKKLCRHLHIPLQSGDDEILKKMHRHYGSGDFLNLIQRIKNSIPEIAITTDVLIGFPGETEIHFQNTLNLIKVILPLKVHIFPYSPRKGTLAFSFKDRVSPDIIKQRMLQLKATAGICALAYKKQFLNKVRDVLVEGQSKDKPNFWQGYTDNYLKVIIPSHQNLKNQLISVKLKQINNDSMLADFG